MAGNPNYSKVSLQLNCDGADASTTFADASPRPKTVTAVGDAKISTARSKFGGASAKFSSAGSCLEVPTSTEFDFGSGDFCVEAFGCLPTLPGVGSLSVIAGCYTTGSRISWLFYVYNDGGTYKLFFDYSADGTAGYTGVSAGVSLVKDTFYHFAAARDGSTLRVFQDGALAGSAALSATLATTSPSKLRVGGYYSGTVVGSWIGYLDEVRITKGAAVYTSAFTPPALPLDGQQYLITGTVEDATGTPAARKVIAVVEATDQVIHTTMSDGTTGAYQIESTASTAHTITAYPAGGEALPALVLRGVVPIAVP